jgi:hypothetical protein
VQHLNSSLWVHVLGCWVSRCQDQCPFQELRLYLMLPSLFVFRVAHLCLLTSLAKPTSKLTSLIRPTHLLLYLTIQCPKASFGICRRDPCPRCFLLLSEYIMMLYPGSGKWIYRRRNITTPCPIRRSPTGPLHRNEHRTRTRTMVPPNRLNTLYLSRFVFKYLKSQGCIGDRV